MSGVQAIQASSLKFTMAAFELPNSRVRWQGWEYEHSVAYGALQKTSISKVQTYHHGSRAGFILVATREQRLTTFRHA
jgi:hypothetical protein